MMRTSTSGYFLLFLAGLACTACTTRPKTMFEKVDASHSGITFSNDLHPDDTLNAFTFTNFYNGGGVGIGDVNNDGHPDLFFTGNQTSSRLYLSQGTNFQFKDITQAAGVGTNTWCSGVNLIDINQDGRLDIYISVAAHTSLKNTRNLLFINQGWGEDGIPTFQEQAAQYGLDFPGFTTQTLFFDYDLDGDLDAFLLNTAPDAQNPNYLRPAINNGQHPSCDRLFRNEGRNEQGYFTYQDVSEQAGIRFEGLGLGVVAADFNNDGYPDIYCSNDFISSDVLYLNNRDGTFQNVIGSAMAHTSLYGMGVDAADLNNDLKVDVLQLDMLPEDNFRQKQMLIGQDFDKKEMSISSRYGYQLQYMRNTFQLNLGTPPGSETPEFSEIGLLAGVARTDWSWAPLLADFDNDGLKDLFVTNGYRKNITDRDFISYAEEFQFFGTDKAKRLKRDELLSKVPEIPLKNYLYRNTGNYLFEDVSEAWGLDEASFANGAAWADLDGDGDLDLVINNVDAEVSVFRNRLNEMQPGTSSLRIRLEGPPTNQQGIGVRATVWAQGQSQVVENHPTRGYLSCVEPILHLGLGANTSVDSVLLEWPGGFVQKHYQVPAGQVLSASYQQATQKTDLPKPTFQPLFESLAQNWLPFQHQEDNFVDFKQHATYAKMLSREGFAVALGDVNGDGRDDLFLGGAYRGSTSQLFIQQPQGTFRAQVFPDSTPGEVSHAAFLDANQDGHLDILVVYGSNERPISVSQAYQPKLFLNDGTGQFKPAGAEVLPALSVSASRVIPLDYDQDGDMDLFIAGRQVPGKYPTSPRSYLLQNDSQQGHLRFTDVSDQPVGQALRQPGLVCDALSVDINQDNWPDLVVVGEWIPISIFLNEQGKRFVPYASEALAQTSGWWKSIAVADLNKDGLPDLIAGNEGLNTFYRASPKYPLEMVGKDFNEDGVYDPIMSHYLAGQRYPTHPRDVLNQQMIQFRRKFPRYAAYAKATFDDLFSKQELAKAEQWSATQLGSSIFLNQGNGSFQVLELPALAQQAPIYGIIPFDFTQDGNLDLLISGNFYPNEVHMGRQDASRGLLLRGNGTGHFEVVPPEQSGLWIRGDARQSYWLQTGSSWLIVTALNNAGLNAHRYRADRSVAKLDL